MIEDKRGRFTDGQNIYYNLPFFCNPKIFADPEIELHILEYYHSTKYNIPIANNLQEADAHTLDIFRIISEEMTACENRQREVSNGK